MKDISNLKESIADMLKGLTDFRLKGQALFSNELEDHIDETSKTIRRTMQGLIWFGIFSFVVLAAPDTYLTTGVNDLIVPFASTSISFSTFLYIAPIVLIGQLTYLHIFLGYYIKICHNRDRNLLPFIFSLENPFAKGLSWFIFYPYVPIIFYILFLKIQPLEEAKFLFLINLFLIFGLVLLQIIRKPRKSTKSSLRALYITEILLFLFIVFSIFCYSWLVSINSPIYRALDLSGADLSSKNLRTISLAKANLVRANLNNADLQGADLRLADLSHANLTGTNLKDANLNGANLTGALLQNAILEKAEMQKAILVLANLENAVLRKANLEGADLSHAFCLGADMEKAVLNKAILYNTRLDKSNLRKAELNGANLETAHLKNANLEGAILRYANLRKAIMPEAYLRKANLNGAILINAHMQGTNLRASQIQNADMESALLQGANLIYAKLNFSNMRRAQLQGADLNSTELCGVNFEGGDLRGANFKKSKIQGAYFEYTDLKGSYFHESEHFGVSFNVLNNDLNAILGEIDPNTQIDWQDLISKIEIKESDKEYIKNKILPTIKESIEKFNKQEYVLLFKNQKNKKEFLANRQQLACSDSYIAKGLLQQFKECNFNDMCSVEQIQSYISKNCKDILNKSNNKISEDKRIKK